VMSIKTSFCLVLTGKYLHISVHLVIQEHVS
jgi:hypothetical protein